MSVSRAAVLRAYDEPITLEERPVPEPGPGQVRVRVKACGVCGSDAFLAAGGFGSRLPVVPGHEASGAVEAVGGGVDELTEGQPVAIHYLQTCGNCRWCAVGRENICERVQRMGVDVDGAWADHVVVPAANALPAPRSLAPVEVAVLTDAVGTAYHALTAVADVQAGERVVVMGVGGVGSNAVQLAVWLGAEVVAISRSPGALALAERMGAVATVTAGDGAAANVRATFDGNGPDVVVQTAGSAEADGAAVNLVGNGGRVVLVGATSERFSLRAVDLIWREAAVLGSRGFTAEDIRAVLRLREQGAIETSHLTNHVRELPAVSSALDDLADPEVLRPVLAPGDPWHW